MRLRALASDVRCLVRRVGLGPTIRKALEGFRTQELLVLVKRLDEITASGSDRRLTLADLTPADLPALAAFNRRRCDSRATGRFAAGLARGERGFVARLDGEVAGYYWWADRDHPHLDRLHIELQEGDVYGFDLFLAEEHRGEGRAVELLEGIETRLRERGYARVWGYVRSDNRPARWLYGSRGYDTVGTVHLRLGRMR
jgi:ribosomal protein S18 acetylase RimI-like enzyme